MTAKGKYLHGNISVQYTPRINTVNPNTVSFCLVLTSVHVPSVFPTFSGCYLLVAMVNYVADNLEC